MKNCPICNELLGDTAEKCFKCNYQFKDQAKVFVCNKCGKHLESEKSSCECGGWATSLSSPEQTQIDSKFSWTRYELKMKAKDRLKSIMLYAIFVCLIISIYSAFQLTARRPALHYDFDQNGNFYTYYTDHGTKVIVEDTKEVPSYLSLRIGWKDITILEGDVFYINRIRLYLLAITLVFYIFIYRPYQVGVNRFFMENIYGKTEQKSVLFGFRQGNYPKVLWKLFLMEFKNFLWFLLLIIPGIVKLYEYRMIPYLLAENPDLDTKEAFRISTEMMNGNKFDVFVLDLSFLLWNALSILTFGIAGVVWVHPYIQATMAQLYDVFRLYSLRTQTVSDTILKGFES
jgi:uncharacterized membrane protein